MAKVAVICLCYNQADYVRSALDSVVNQSFKDWELIVVDDASTDNSLWEIEQYKLANPKLPIRTIFLGENVGNCRAFNQALVNTNAKYVIDLAADDILLPERLEEGVKNMDRHPEVAINFTNAEIVDAKGSMIKTHFPVGPLKRSEVYVPEGDIFAEVIRRYFICPPTCMIRNTFLKEIGGYDENLAYEDFDIYVRLSKKYKFSYTDKILVKKSSLANSWAQKQYQKGNSQLLSTYLVCEKIFQMIENPDEKKALLFRLTYEAKQALVYLRLKLFLKFCFLGMKTLLRK